MCKELEKQMKEMLQGSKPTITTKAINILAMDIDKKFANVDEKLDIILKMLKDNKADTDKKLSDMKTEQALNCAAHKAEITEKFKVRDADLETISYFSKHPKVLKAVGVIVLFIIGLALGKSHLLDLIKF